MMDDAKVLEQIAALERVVEAQRRVMIDAIYGLSKARIWGGMDWHYNPLSPLHYRPVMQTLEACVNDPNGPLQPARLPLNEADILRIVQLTIRGTTLRLTRDVGPYENTEPTHDLVMLVRAIEDAHGIRANQAGKWAG